MKPLTTLIRIVIVGLIWSVFFLEGIRVILLTNWHFDLIDSRHWSYLWDLWMNGWVIDDKREWAFILIILSFIPLWLTGWASLSLIKWEVLLKNIWQKIYSLYRKYILKNEKEEQERVVVQKPVIKRKKSYKEIRPRDLSAIRATPAENIPAPSPIANNRTLPNVKPIIMPTAAPIQNNSILDHALFKFDEDESDFDLNFDDLDKIQSKPKETPKTENSETQQTNRETKSYDRKTDRSNKQNNDNNRSKDNRKNNRPNPIPSAAVQAPTPKNLGNSSLEVIKQKGYQVITSATIKNNFIDFIGVADGQLCVCVVDKETGDWLADEERFNDEEPLWFSESSHRISPVRGADIAQKYLSEKLKESGFDFKISTYVIIQYGNIINAEDMFETWDNMNINVVRIDRGMPRELKLFAKTLEEADNSIDIEQFEKIKKLIRNLV